MVKLRWLDRPVRIPNGQVGAGMRGTQRVLQISYWEGSPSFQQAGKPPEDSGHWSQWDDVPAFEMNELGDVWQL